MAPAARTSLPVSLPRPALFGLSSFGAIAGVDLTCCARARAHDRVVRYRAPPSGLAVEFHELPTVHGE